MDLHWLITVSLKIYVVHRLLSLHLVVGMSRWTKAVKVRCLARRIMRSMDALIRITGQSQISRQVSIYSYPQGVNNHHRVAH